MNTIALDAHSGNCWFAIFTPRGQLSKALDCPTSARHLIDVVRSVRSPKQLVVEESHMAAWVKRTLDPYVDRLIVCDPQRNRWIAGEEFNDDRSSAYKLGKLLMHGYAKEIRHAAGEEAELRRLFLHYYDLNMQVTRFKNKLKAVFRGEAIATKGKGIYEEDGHEEWLGKLRGLPHLRHEARQLFALVDQLEELKHATYREMTRRARAHPFYALLNAVPGVGPVVSTGYLALVETPHRFSKRNKLWRYAGLGQVRHISDEVVYQDRASHSGNRALKWVVFMHFHGAVETSKGSNRFKRKFDALKQRGLRPGAARRHVCRMLLSTIWAMWRKEEAYRD